MIALLGGEHSGKVGMEEELGKKLHQRRGGGGGGEKGERVGEKLAGEEDGREDGWPAWNVARQRRRRRQFFSLAKTVAMEALGK